MTKNKGFTLIEVLIATVILGGGLVAIFSAFAPCMSMLTASKRFQEIRWTFGLGELKYPLVDFEEVEDLVVDEDSELVEDDETIGKGFVYSRSVDTKIIEENTPDDGLFVVRTKVSWGEGPDSSEEIVQLVWKKDGGEYEP